MCRAPPMLDRWEMERKQVWMGMEAEGTAIRGESQAAGAFFCISVQQLSKTIFFASHSTTEMEEAAV